MRVYLNDEGVDFWSRQFILYKTCSGCLKEKPRDEFYVDNHVYSKMANKCKACKNLQQKEWRTKNPERYKAQRRKKK